MKKAPKHRMFGPELPSQAEASTRGLRSFYRERSQLTQHNVRRWYDVGGVPNRTKLQKNEARTAETCNRLPVSHFLMCLSTVRDRHEWHKKEPLLRLMKRMHNYWTGWLARIATAPLCIIAYATVLRSIPFIEFHRSGSTTVARRFWCCDLSFCLGVNDTVVAQVEFPPAGSWTTAVD